MIDDPLGFIIAPVAPANFMERHFGRSPLLSAGGDPSRFDLLLTPRAVDAFIDTADLRADMVTLARGGRIVEPADYVSPSGRVIPSAVAEQYLNGATVILQHLHDSVGALGTLCRALERHFSAHAQANIYLTPPGEQGFAPHADTHDVFVLQVAGRKSWRLYADERATAPAETCLLHPGCCLYLPRGVVHDAVSEPGGPSLHITLGLITKSWLDLLAAALAELRERAPQLTESLPPAYAHAGVDRAALHRRLAELAARIDLPAVLDQALDRLTDDYLHDRRPPIAGLFHSSFAEISAGGMYRARKLVQWRLRKDGRDLLLAGPGGDLRFDAGDRLALDLALSGQPFSPPDLSAADPQRLVRKLWANGYLEALGAP